MRLSFFPFYKSLSSICPLYSPLKIRTNGIDERQEALSSPSLLLSSILLSECCAGGPGSYLCLELQQRLLWFCVQRAHRNGLGGAGCSQGPLGPHCHPFHYVCRAIAMYMRVLCLSHPPFPCFALRRVKRYKYPKDMLCIFCFP